MSFRLAEVWNPLGEAEQGSDPEAIRVRLLMHGPMLQHS